MLDENAAAAHIGQRWEESVVPTLHDYIRIPNKSPAFDPQWQEHGHMQRAVELLYSWAAESELTGFTQEIIALPGRTPVLYCEVEATTNRSENDSCVLLYGHYDKQPEFDGWEAGLSPWEPVQRDNRLYGRGGADDGYALFGCLTAIEALQQQGADCPRCVILIEGCEESGSFDLPHYMDLLKPRIGVPQLVVCLDAECGNYEQLWLTTSLRGMLPGVLSVNILSEGQHSGGAGGIVPSSFRILRQLFERIERAETGALHESLLVDIPEPVQSAARRVAQVLGPAIVDRFPWAGRAGPQADDLADLVLANTWHPSLATVGLDGAPAISNAGNTLRPGTQAKLVFRLPPTLDARRAAEQIKRVLESDPPYGAQVAFNVETPQSGWHAPAEAPWLSQALQASSQRFFHKPAMHMGCGGTIPFMKMLGDAYPHTQFMVTGVLGPHSNAHGPNEFLHIDAAKRVTACVASVLADAATAL